ncbi:Uncharacterized protein SCF082_LOCUS30058 [Durusdinium trenchii]|uniref:Uncharacterized protein n=1 Tax=Durusdinium trenchii TaxID=1381693 RepID=A0ABP0MY98_9DINO
MKWSGAGAPCLVLLTVSLVEVSHSIAIQSYAEQLKEAQAAEVQSDRFYAEVALAQEADERHLAELAAPQVSVSTALAMLRGVLADGKARVAKLNKQEEESKELFQKQERSHQEVTKIRASFQAKKISKEFLDSELKEETRIWSYWSKVREHEHRQFLAALRIQHATMRKVSNMLKRAESPH